jgi:hypothetical protein
LSKLAGSCSRDERSGFVIASFKALLSWPRTKSSPEIRIAAVPPSAQMVVQRIARNDTIQAIMGRLKSSFTLKMRSQTITSSGHVGGE